MADFAGKYGWQRVYLKEGIRSLDTLTVNDLLNVRALYSTVHLPFVNLLQQSYTSDTEVGKFLEDLAKNLQAVVKLIGRVAGTAGRRAKEEELKELFSTMELLNPQLEQLSKLADDFVELREDVEAAQKTLDITTEGLRSAHKIVSQQLKEARTRKVKYKGIFRTLTSPLTGFVGASVKGAYYRTLGYGVAGALGAVHATASQMLLGYRGVGRRRRRAAFEEALPGYGTGRGDEVLGRPPTSFPTTPMGGMPIGSLPGIQTPIARGGRYGKRDLRYDAAPIWYFFHYQAHQARWTRDIYRLLKGRTVGGMEAIGGGGGEGLIPDEVETILGYEGAKKLLGGTKSLLGRIKGVVGGVIGYIGAALGGKWLGELGRQTYKLAPLTSVATTTRIAEAANAARIAGRAALLLSIATYAKRVLGPVGLMLLAGEVGWYGGKGATWGMKKLGWYDKLVKGLMPLTPEGKEAYWLTPEGKKAKARHFIEDFETPYRPAWMTESEAIAGGYAEQGGNAAGQFYRDNQATSEQVLQELIKIAERIDNPRTVTTPQENFYFEKMDELLQGHISNGSSLISN